MEGLEGSTIAVVSELVSKFSFIGSLTPQKEFNSNLKLSIGLLAGAGAGLAAAAGGFFAWTSSVLDTIDPLAQLNRETGVAVESIQALGFAASVNGSSTEALTGTFREMSKRLGEFVQTGGGPAKEIIEKLGISVRDAEGNVRSADDVFLGLSDTLQGLSRAEQANVLDKLGIDQSLIQLVSLSADEVGKLTDRARSLGIVTQEQADSAAAFNDSLTTLKFGLSGIQNAVAVGFAPALTRLTERFIGFLEVNKDLIQNGLTWLGEVLEATIGFVERIAPVVLTAAAAFGVWWLATGGLVAIMGVLLSPVVLIGLGIAALLLIVEDLIVAFNGGESAIRKFFLEFLGFDIVPIMQGIVDAFMWMIDTVSGLLAPWFASIGGLFSAVIKVFKGDFAGALDDLKLAFSAFGDFVLGIISGLLPDWVLQYLGSDQPPPGQGSLPSGSGQDRLDVPMLSPNDAVALGMPGNTSNTTSNIEQQVQINVSSSDPKQAGAAVNDALQEQLKNAKTQANRGGR